MIFNGFSRKYSHRHHRKHFRRPGNVVWDISNEKYFHQFSNSYFELYFLLNFVEILMIFEANLMVMYDYSMVVQAKRMKIIGFFDEIEQKHDPK